MKYTCALFDVDGTLVDSTGAHALAWHRAFKKFGFDIPVEQMKGDIGLGGKNITQKHLNPGEVKTFGKDIIAIHLELLKNEYIKDIKPFPCAEELLHTLSKRGVNIILASSALAEIVEKFIDLLKIRDVILGYVSGSDVKKAKPDPDIFKKALEKCCVSKEETIVIGDSPYDVEAATKAELPSIALPTGGSEVEKLKDATYIFPTLKELCEHVDELFANLGKKDC